MIIVPAAPEAYTWSFNAHTIPAKEVPTHLSDAKTKAGRGGHDVIVLESWQCRDFGLALISRPVVYP